VTIDDYDAGQPPLEEFRLHTIDTFMLHHRYVRNVAHSSDDAAVTGAIIDMAHRQNLKVIAEGVETQDQLNLLSEQGCDAMQGFYFSEALPAARLDELLKNSTVFGAATGLH
jgi:EAL domain-containing protein (putative c-di-GMP-specific phosphodiesterase class I)